MPRPRRLPRPLQLLLRRRPPQRLQPQRQHQRLHRWPRQFPSGSCAAGGSSRQRRPHRRQPRAKKLASQMGVDLATVRGSGPHGRIQAEDVEKAGGQPISVPRVAEGTAPAVSGGASSAAAAPTAPAGSSFGRPGETMPFNTLQGAVNRNMEASLAVPCFRVGYTITTDKLDAFYKQVKPKGVTMTALLAKAVAVTLARHPQVNAATTPAGMTYPADVNVAVAVAMEDGGLITPVLRNADRTDLYEMSRQWGDLVKRSRQQAAAAGGIQHRYVHPFQPRHVRC